MMTTDYSVTSADSGDAEFTCDLVRTLLLLLLLLWLLTLMNR